MQEIWKSKERQISNPLHLFQMDEKNYTFFNRKNEAMDNEFTDFVFCVSLEELQSLVRAITDNGIMGLKPED